MHRFYAPSLDPGDEIVTLPRDESEHLTRVLRIGAGDTVSVFDGRGREFLARVAPALNREVRVEILSRIEPPPESSIGFTLAQAVLKGEKMDDVVRDAVMLGAHAIQPVVSARAEVTVASLIRGSRLDRWRRVALASTKQSRRAVLAEIRTPLSFDTYLEEPGADLRLMLVEPGAGEGVQPVSALRQLPVPSEVVLLIGPEGGWTEAECRAARERGFKLVTLGPRTLRADAVAVAALSVFQFVWDAL
ncbi:MAG TPA: 16S rRNA (uracil(1498)-N(3))-methyltransferase [Vicinamibacterales bacterium]|nr:16S rRNA (uracil(1498)-N(3))-methyltransferase [Vicinamibacterales bacterium]